MGPKTFAFVATADESPILLIVHHSFHEWPDTRVLEHIRGLAAVWAAAYWDEDPGLYGASFDWCDFIDHAQEITEYIQGLNSIEVELEPLHVWKYDTIYHKTGSDDPPF